MCLPQLSGRNPVKSGSTNTAPIAVPIENSPSTVRYSPAPTTALITLGSLIDTATLLCSSAVPTKKQPNETISASTTIITANTMILAISIGIRFGTASSEALITPVEYSVVISSTPSTQ